MMSFSRPNKKEGMTMHHDNQGGLFGWGATGLFMLVNMITPQDWSYVMASIAAGCTAAFYVARVYEIVSKKKKDEGEG